VKQWTCSAALFAVRAPFFVPTPPAIRTRRGAPSFLRSASERARLEQRLEAVRRRVDQAYTDKLDGKITEDFWQRKQTDWHSEERQIEMAVAGLEEAKTSDRVLDAKKDFRSRE